MLKFFVVQVDDCIAKFLYMKGMTGKVKQLKAEGKPMPKDFQQLEKEFGERANKCLCNAYSWVISETVSGSVQQSCMVYDLVRCQLHINLWIACLITSAMMCQVQVFRCSFESSSDFCITSQHIPMTAVSLFKRMELCMF